MKKRTAKSNKRIIVNTQHIDREIKINDSLEKSKCQLEIDKTKSAEEIANLKKALNIANNKYRCVINNERKYRKSIELLESENALLKRKINEIVSREFNVLERMEHELNKIEQEHNKVLIEYKALEKSYKNIKSKYNAISTSKLGKLTITYWKYKKGFKLRNDK